MACSLAAVRIPLTKTPQSWMLFIGLISLLDTVYRIRGHLFKEIWHNLRGLEGMFGFFIRD